MAKAKKHKNSGRRNKGIMGASHIPYAQRLKLQQRDRIAVNRHHSARVAMFCKSIAIHRVKGAGYKSLVKFSLRYKEIEDELYEDLEYGMAKAKRRLAQMGMEISGDLYAVQVPGLSKRDQEVHDHAMQSAQISMIASAIAMNDVWGYGKVVQERIDSETNKVTDEYNRNGFDWLLGEMEKLGFLIVDGEVRAFLDDDDKPVTPAKARKEGYPEAQQEKPGRLPTDSEIKDILRRRNV